MLLKEKRIEKGMLQKDVAKVLQISESSICLYEKGKRTPPLDVLIKLSRLYGCSIDELVKEEKGEGGDFHG